MSQTSLSCVYDSDNNNNINIICSEYVKENIIVTLVVCRLLNERRVRVKLQTDRIILRLVILVKRLNDIFSLPTIGYHRLPFFFFKLRTVNKCY